MTGLPVVEPRTAEPGRGTGFIHRYCRCSGDESCCFGKRNADLKVRYVSNSETNVFRKVHDMARIEPLQPPYSDRVGECLEKMMPPGVPPILLFRTFAKNLPMASSMNGWGSYELGKQLSLSMRERELVIDRTTAKCQCEYEWGVHVVFFAERVGLSREQLSSLMHGTADDACWANPRERLVIRAVDALHNNSDIDDGLWAELTSEFSEAELLDLTMLCGWYHAISFTARVARVPLEVGAPRFCDYLT